jgi:hypothetical protein
VQHVLGRNSPAPSLSGSTGAMQGRAQEQQHHDVQQP